MKDNVRVVLVGDHGVGKTSLIKALLTDTFVDTADEGATLVPVMPVAVLGPEWSADGVSVQVVDTVSRPAQISAPVPSSTCAELSKADVICIVYDASEPAADSSTFEAVASVWLPACRQHGRVNTPVIVVGNKTDAKQEPSTNADLERQFLPLTNEFKEVEFCVECSARNIDQTSDNNVHEVFYFAQKAVLYPTAPLVEFLPDGSRQLRAECARALLRIFRLLDEDTDGLLSDRELAQFQIRVFDVSLSREEIVGLKGEISKIDGGLDAGQVTTTGFLYLHELFIQKGRIETVWAVLRRFGYDDSLQLDPHFVHPTLSLPEQQQSSCCARLTERALQFLTTLFHRYDTNRDRSLTHQEVQSIFAGLCPDGRPPANSAFQSFLQLSPSLSVSLATWIGWWQALTLYQYRQTLEFLAYLGYQGNTLECVSFLPHRAPRSIQQQEQQQQLVRNVFRVGVFGANGTGKTSFRRCLAGLPYLSARTEFDGVLVALCKNNRFKKADTAAPASASTSNADESSTGGGLGGSFDQLVFELIEFSPTVALSTLSTDVLSTLDLAVVLFQQDAGWSLGFAEQLLSLVSGTCPTVLLAMKEDASQATEARFHRPKYQQPSTATTTTTSSSSSSSNSSKTPALAASDAVSDAKEGGGGKRKKGGTGGDGSTAERAQQIAVSFGCVFAPVPVSAKTHRSADLMAILTEAIAQADYSSRLSMPFSSFLGLSQKAQRSAVWRWLGYSLVAGALVGGSYFAYLHKEKIGNRLSDLKQLALEKIDQSK